MFSRKRGLVLFAFAIEEHFGNDGDHVKGGDLVIGLNVSVGASVVRIVPEGGYLGVLPALSEKDRPRASVFRRFCFLLYYIRSFDLCQVNKRKIW